VLSQAEFRRLQAIVDHGEDPGAPSHPATKSSTRPKKGQVATSASNRDLRYKARRAARS
jgi:hypothetical protein